MQVGDLVEWASLDEIDTQSECKIGVVVEWDEATDQLPEAGWVRWIGNSDWSIVYEDQVVVISEVDNVSE
jgi:hypothetical protein